jgi:hypothetical protein
LPKPTAIAAKTAKDHRHSYRETIDRGTQLDEAELDRLWALAEGAMTGEFPDDLSLGGVRSRADVECGLAATLVTCGHRWMEDHPEARAWCRARLLAPFADPPPTHQFDDAHALATDRWDAFCADALPQLWVADPDDPELRAGIARLVVHLHRQTVRRVMARVAEQPPLRAELRRMEHLALVWARWLAFGHERRQREDAARYGIEDAPSVDDLPELETPTREALAAFETGELSDRPPRLSEWVATTPEGLVRTRRRRYRAFSLLDPDYLMAAFDHLLVLTPEFDPDEIERRLAFAEDLATLIAEGMQPDDEGDLDGTPYEHEYTALDRLGSLVASVPITRASEIWRPLLEPGSIAHYWVEHFLRRYGGRYPRHAPLTPRLS